MGDVTRLLERWNDGDAEALGALVTKVYAELRRIAGGLLRDERDDHTLQPTALVYEAYLRLTGISEMRIESRRHFYGAAPGGQTGTARRQPPCGARDGPKSGGGP